MRLIITSSTSTRTNRRRTRRRSTRLLWAPSVRIPTLWRRCRQFLRRISYPWLVRFSRRIERGFSSRRGYGVRSRFVCVNRRRLDVRGEVLAPIEVVIPKDARSTRMGQDVSVTLTDPVPGERPVRLGTTRIVVVQEGHRASGP